MSEALWYTGDALTVLRTLEDASVDLVLTSPPFLALRSYLPADHPDKDREMGSEATPGTYVDALMEVVEECRRVLAPHGSICLELGDTYSGSGGAGGDYDDGGLREGQSKFDGSARRGNNRVQYEGMPSIPGPKHYTVAKSGSAWPLAKSLTLVPEIVRFTMVYGFNPLTGRQTEPWRLRNVIRWVRPNPPVGALGDKFRPATTEMLVACVSKDRYFDLDAVRESRTPSRIGGPREFDRIGAGRQNTEQPEWTEGGAPPLDWWQIPTHGYRGAHYATWPPALCVKPILAMCPPTVCLTCGEPSRRIVESVRTRMADGQVNPPRVPITRYETNDGSKAIGMGNAIMATNTTTGWSDCGHDNWRNGVVLDPFAGTGVVGAVATGHARDAILIDLDARNLALAEQRVGMFLRTAEPVF